MSLQLTTEPGWFGVFTRDQAPGAFANSTRVEKIVREVGDAHPIGARGVVLGSIRASIPGFKAQIFYFVEWDDRPRIAVGVQDYKIRKVVLS